MVRRKCFVLATSLVLLLGVGASAGDAGDRDPTAQGVKAEFQPARNSSPSLPTTDWAVRLDVSADPRVVAAETGFVDLGPIGNLDGFRLFRKSAGGDLPVGFESNATLTADVERQLARHPAVTWVEQQKAVWMERRSEPTDPHFADQWHLNNTGQSGGTPGEDASVLPAWASGYDGSGITVAIVDDGLEHVHPDFASQYNPLASWDFRGDDPDPSPGLSDSHGTSVGGVAVAADDGTKCGVGAAHGADVSGIRLIGGWVTDAQIAGAITYAGQVNDIYNNSWGPGAWLVAPEPLTLAAFESAVADGRGGRGSIYVWAAGNDADLSDDVNYDGYANSRFTIAVAATDHNGVRSSYSEPGAALIVNAGSSGDGVGITTTDRLGGVGYNGLPDSDCTNEFGGTSSASPLVAGIIALMLDANPELGWRDVQHILVQTAEKNDPTDGGWSVNGAGHDINHAYGFGRVDAAAAVDMAVGWDNVTKSMAISSGRIVVDTPIPDNSPAGISSSHEVADDIIVEHVEVIFNAQHSYRGDLRVVLTSPSGTESVMAGQRLTDSGDDYTDWVFMSVRNWDEPSAGQWTLTVSDLASFDVGVLEDWELVVHGQGGSITGAVTEEGTGDPLAGIRVSVIPSDSDELVSVSETDGSGLYIIDGLPSGQYRVEYADPTGAHIGEWYDDQSDSGSATLVAVTAGEETPNIDGVLAINHPPSVDDMTFSVKESAAVGTVVGVVTATDPNGSPLTFSITGGNMGGGFAIVSEDGTLKVASALDHENRAQHGLTVSVTDGVFADVAVITVNVEDVNEAPTISGSIWSIPEDAAPGTLVGALAATDPDGDQLTYEIVGGDPAGAFAVSASGGLRTARLLDFESTAVYSLSVEAADGEFVAAATITVSVIDVPEFTAPTFATFGDVPLGFLFFTEVEWLRWAGITKGCDPPANTHFCPEDSMTRGQMAAFLRRALSDELTPSMDAEFVDDDESVFEADIEWLGATGITKGCNPPVNDRFCPDDPVTRGQMAAFLVRALGLTERGFVDFVDDDTSVFEGDIERLATAGITKGCNPPLNDRFCPDESVTRGQMAAFLYRALFR